MIFDECHRSQFGEMHRAITKKFRRYHLFGFTGTPIFPSAGSSSARAALETTDNLFGDRLHAYTIMDAIRDGNVLPFKADYVATMREKEEIKDEEVPDILREEALLAPERLANITRYILAHFDQKTRRDGQAYKQTFTLNIAEKVKDKEAETKTYRAMKRGFNAILATASIKAAKLYYMEFLRQMALLPPSKRLKLALIYSYAANENPENLTGLFDDENPEGTGDLDAGSREFLDDAIRRYNETFGTSYSTASDQFQNYYKDVSLRVKNGDVDLLIVVGMFLTGFDAPGLNTLWVDKNLRMHGLLQAFSRTNRILNSVKTHGNIVCFRNLEEATNRAIAAFGSKEAHDIVLLKTFEEYLEGYDDHPGYLQLIAELREKYPPGNYIVGEEAEKEFVRLFGSILKARNLLLTFDEFAAHDPFATGGDTAHPTLEMQNYQSRYISLYEKWHPKPGGDTEAVSILGDVTFEMELIKQQEINIDYILYLVRQMQAGEKTIDLTELRSLVDSNPGLRDKRELIEDFIARVNPGENLDTDNEWVTLVKSKMREELDGIIDRERLRKEETYDFMRNQIRQGYVQELGTELPALLTPGTVSLFNPDRPKILRRIIEAFKAFVRRFGDIASESYLS